MTISDSLRACAAEVRRGWTQGNLEDSAGRVCAVGAMYRVLKLDDAVWPIVWSPQARAVGAYLLRAIGRSDMAEIFQWNDAKSQTQETVALAFELGAILVEHDVEVMGRPGLDLEYQPGRGAYVLSEIGRSDVAEVQSDILEEMPTCQ